MPAHRQPAAREDIQITPQITVPDIPAGGSNMLSDDDICMLAMDAYEMLDANTGIYILSLTTFSTTHF